MNEKETEHFDQLKSQIELVEKELFSLSRQESIDIRAIVLLEQLRRATELTKGALLVAEARLISPLFVLLRVLFEGLIWSFWISQSTENAHSFSERPKEEATKHVRIMCENGTAYVETKDTREDKTEDTIQKLKGVSKSGDHRIVNLAQEMKLGDVYDYLYRFSSLYIHNAEPPLNEQQREQQRVAALPAIHALLSTVLLIARNRIRYGKDTSTKDLRSEMNLPSQNSRSQG